MILQIGPGYLPRCLVEMNILPCINFLSMMILLSPSPDYCVKIDKLLCWYVWNNGHPKLKFLVEEQDGLALPNPSPSTYALSWLGSTAAHLSHGNL